MSYLDVEYYKFSNKKRSNSSGSTAPRCIICPDTWIVLARFANLLLLSPNRLFLYYSNNNNSFYNLESYRMICRFAILYLYSISSRYLTKLINNPAN